MDLIRVTKGGLSSTLQDEGRNTGLGQGVPPGGAADLYSYRVNNLVLGNQAGAAAIELVAYGGEFEFLADTVIALTGADLNARLNGKPVPRGEPLEVHAGDTLTTETARQSRLAYLGVAGGLDGDESLESRSTYTVGQLGGHQGRSLIPGDVLRRHTEPGAPGNVAAGDICSRFASPTSSVRFIRGPQSEYFESAYESLGSITYTVSSRSDRMAYRMEGPAPRCSKVERTADTGSGVTDIVEEGNPVGGIQVAGGSELICLGRDCGTSGGYAKIGCIISVDVSRLAQLMPGDTFSFAEVDIAEAMNAKREADDLLLELEHRRRVTSTLLQGHTACVGASWH